MSKLLEMLREGKPPAFAGSVIDPQSPDRAIPRALRELETKHSAKKIAKDTGYSVDTLKKTWKI